MYPFRLQVLDKKRTLYAFKKVERDVWIKALNSALGYVDIKSLYNIQVLYKNYNLNRKELEREDLEKYGLLKIRILNW